MTAAGSVAAGRGGRGIAGLKGAVHASRALRWLHARADPLNILARMPPPAPVPPSTVRTVDAVALERVRARLAGAAQPPWLHGEVARRMAERLPVIRLRPARILDWWPASGASAEALRRAYPDAERRGVWPEGLALPAARPRRWWSPRRWGATDDAAALPAEAVGAGACDLLWANMTLHWCADPAAEMRRWHAALAVDGFLMFSTLGPGTAQALREVYRAQGWGTPHAPFVDMHDLGDMLLEAGFADPVMDQETLTLTWRDAAAMRAELRTLGANVDPARYKGLRTPRWRDALAAACRADAEGRAALGFEIVYGHAVRPRPRPRVAAETSVGLDEMREILRNRPDH